MNLDKVSFLKNLDRLRHGLIKKSVNKDIIWIKVWFLKSR